MLQNIFGLIKKNTNDFFKLITKISLHVLLFVTFILVLSTINSLQAYQVEDKAYWIMAEWLSEDIFVENMLSQYRTDPSGTSGWNNWGLIDNDSDGTHDYVTNTTMQFEMFYNAVGYADLGRDLCGQAKSKFWLNSTYVLDYVDIYYKDEDQRLYQITTQDQEGWFDRRGINCYPEESTNTNLNIIYVKIVPKDISITEDKFLEYETALSTRRYDDSNGWNEERRHNIRLIIANEPETAQLWPNFVKDYYEYNGNSWTSSTQESLTSYTVSEDEDAGYSNDLTVYTYFRDNDTGDSTTISEGFSVHDWSGNWGGSIGYTNSDTSNDDSSAYDLSITYTLGEEHWLDEDETILDAGMSYSYTDSYEGLYGSVESTFSDSFSVYVTGIEDDHYFDDDGDGTTNVNDSDDDGDGIADGSDTDNVYTYSIHYEEDASISKTITFYDVDDEAFYYTISREDDEGNDYGNFTIFVPTNYTQNFSTYQAVTLTSGDTGYITDSYFDYTPGQQNSGVYTYDDNEQSIKWTYDSSDSTYTSPNNTLREGEIHYATYTLVIDDDDRNGTDITQTFTVTIQGVNDTPVIETKVSTCNVNTQVQYSSTFNYLCEDRTYEWWVEDDSTDSYLTDGSVYEVQDIDPTFYKTIVVFDTDDRKDSDDAEYTMNNYLDTTYVTYYAQNNDLTNCSTDDCNFVGEPQFTVEISDYASGIYPCDTWLSATVEYDSEYRDIVIVSGDPVVKGDYYCRLTVTDYYGASDTIDFNFNILNEAPIIQYKNTSDYYYYQTFNNTVDFFYANLGVTTPSHNAEFLIYDDDDKAVSLSVTETFPDDWNFVTYNRLTNDNDTSYYYYSVAIPKKYKGTTSFVTINVQDEYGDSDYYSFSVNVSNFGPKFHSDDIDDDDNVFIYSSTNQTYTLNFTDKDDIIDFEFYGTTFNWLEFEFSTINQQVIVSINPSIEDTAPDYRGVYYYTIIASENETTTSTNQTTSMNFTITYANTPFEVTAEYLIATENEYFNYTLSVVDPDGDVQKLSLDDDQVIFKTENGDSWISLDEDTFILTGTPQDSSPLYGSMYREFLVSGTEQYPFTVDDVTTYYTDLYEKNLIITVNNVNDSPTLSVKESTVDFGATLNVTENIYVEIEFSLNDVDINFDDQFTYSVSNLPNWLTFDETSLTLYGTLTQDYLGDYHLTNTDYELVSYNVSITVFDTANTSDNITFDLIQHYVSENSIISKEQIIYSVYEDDSVESTNIATLTASDTDGTSTCYFSSYSSNFSVVDGDTLVEIDDSLSYTLTANIDLIVTVNFSSELYFDYETNESESVEFVCVDNQDNNLFSSLEVEILVRDTSESASGIYFDSNLKTTKNIDEGFETISDYWIGKIIVNDQDGQNDIEINGDDFETYIITNNIFSGITGIDDDDNYFDLYIKSGVVLDYETTQNYSVTIVATDTADTSLALSQVVTINLTDIQDIVTSIKIATTSIDENVDTSSGVTLSQIIITDQDDGNILSLSSGSEYFNIYNDDPTFNLLIRSGITLNFEVTPSYEIEIQVYDQIEDVYTYYTYSINVNNVIEAPTDIILGDNLSITENEDFSTGVFISNIDVEDDDGTHELSLSGVDTSYFEIVNEILYFKTAETIDFESYSTFNVTITALDQSDSSYYIEKGVSVSINNKDEEPVWLSTPITMVNEDVTYSYTLIIQDYDEDEVGLEYGVSLPSWLSFSETYSSNGILEGVLEGVPTDSEIGNHVVELVATSSVHNIEQSFIIEVVSVFNDYPIVSGTPDTTVYEDEYYDFLPSVSDIDFDDGQLISTFSIKNQPSWATFDERSGKLYGTPESGDIGTDVDIVISVEDEDGYVGKLATFDITIEFSVDDVVLSSTVNTSVSEGGYYSATFNIQSDDYEFYDAYFKIDNMPDWLTFNYSRKNTNNFTAILNGTAVEYYSESIDFEDILITVTDNVSGERTFYFNEFNIELIGDNNTPTASKIEVELSEDNTVTFNLVGSDTDTDQTLTFFIDSYPDGTVELDGKLLTYTPVADYSGTDSFTYYVEDSVGNASAIQDVTLTINAVEDKPIVYIEGYDDIDTYCETSSDCEIGADLEDPSTISGLVFWLDATNVDGIDNSSLIDGDEVNSWYDASGADQGLTQTTSSLRPVLDSTGLNSKAVVTFDGSDDYLSRTTFSNWPVDDITIFIIQKSVLKDQSVLAIEGGSLGETYGRFNIHTPFSDGYVAWDYGTTSGGGYGRIYTTIPTDFYSSFQLYKFEYDSSDDGLSFDYNGSQYANENDGIVSVVDINNQEGYELFLGRDDGVNDIYLEGSVAEVLVYNAVLSTNEITKINYYLADKWGLESIIDSDGDGVTDDTDTSTLPNLISVSEDNSFGLTFSSTDVDGDSMTLSIENKPSWLSFDTATGELTGTPDNDDVGTYSNVEIAVFDGTATVSMNAFNIEVVNVNDAPTMQVISDQRVSEDYSIVVTFNVTDVDSIFTSSNFTITDSGELDIEYEVTTSKSMTITPSANVFGETLFSITVVDGDYTSSTSFSLTVVSENDSVIIEGSPDTSIDEDIEYSFTPTTTDIENDIITFNIDNLPSWATFNYSTGRLVGTPNNSDVGLYQGIVIYASDGYSISSLSSFDIEVVNVNDSPTIEDIADQQTDEDTILSIDLSIADVDDILTISSLSFESSNSSLIDDSSFELTTTDNVNITPLSNQSGESGITVNLTDESVTVSITFDLIVNAVNDAPTISGDPAEFIDEDIEYSFTVTASDIDNDILTFNITNMPSWATFNQVTGVLVGTPNNDDIGTHSGILINVFDNSVYTELSEFSITVKNINDVLTWNTSPETEVAEDSYYSFEPSANEVDAGSTVVYTALDVPAWASYNRTTNLLSGTPTNNNVGTHNVVITASSDGDTITQSYTLTVTNTNDEPIFISSPEQTATEDMTYAYSIEATDDDNSETVSFSMVYNTSWLTLVDNGDGTGTLSGEPKNNVANTTSYIKIAGISGSDIVYQGFNVYVENTNDPPTLTGNPDTQVDEDSYYYFIPTVVDDDDDDIFTYSISNMPGWATFNEMTGELVGTPNNDDVGLFTTINIYVTDSGYETATLATFSILVENTNDSPMFSTLNNISVIDGSPITVTTSEDTTVTVSFSIIDVDTIDIFDTSSFSFESEDINLVNNTNGYLFVSTTNVEIYPQSDANGTTNITLTVDDGSITNTTTFVLSVTSVNDSLSISGDPDTSVDEDSEYYFIPTVADIDSTTFSFSIINKPSWATFNESTGELTGTPNNNDVGSTSAIEIGASDEDFTVSLNTFVIEIINTNDVPIISTINTQTVSEDMSITVTFNITDNDFTDKIEFSELAFESSDTTIVSFDNHAITSTSSITITPSTNVNGSLFITLTVTDNLLTTSETFELIVEAVNDAPEVASVNTSINEDSFIILDLESYDLDGDDLTFSVFNTPSIGTFEIDDTYDYRITYTPEENSIETVTFNYQSNDGFLDSNIAIVTISVLVSNDAPTVSRTEVSVTEDYSLEIDLTNLSYDIDGDTLSYYVTKEPEYGTIDNILGLLKYYPDENYNGIDTLEFTVSDGKASSDVGVVTINVVAENDVPTASDIVVETQEETSVEITLVGNDIDANETFTYTLVTPVSSGNTVLINGIVTYRPTDNFYGDDYFTYKVIDSSGATSNEVATVSISITNISDSPSAISLSSATIAENTDASTAVYIGAISVTDVDGTNTVSLSGTDSDLFYVTGSDPSWSLYMQTTDEIDYEATPTYSITLTATDDTDSSLSYEQVITINVANENEEPLFAFYDFEFSADTPFELEDYLDYDADDNYTWELVYSEENLSISINVDTGAVTFNIEGSSIGVHDVSIRVTDNASQMAYDDIVVTVNVNTEIIGETVFSTETDTTISIAQLDVAVQASMIVSDGTYEFDELDVLGSLDINEGTVDITDLDVSGGDLSIDGGDVSIDSLTVSDLSSLSITEGTISIGDIVASDEDVESITISGGTVSVMSSEVDINNESGWVSPGSSPGLLEIEGDYTQSSNGGLLIEIEGIEFSISDAYYEYDRLAISGDLSLGGSLYIDSTYTHEQDDEFVIITWNGTISGEFDTITTPSVSSGLAWYMGDLYTTGVIRVVSDSSPEISIGDREYRATEDEQLIIDPGSGDNTLIERDDNGYEIVSYEVVSTKNGDAEFIGTRFYYQASSNYNGVDEVTYRVTNEYGYEGGIETLTINVAEVNDIPEISGSPATVIDEGSYYSFTPTVYDVDEGIEGESYEFSINNQPSWISFDSETGELSGTPDNEDVGTYTGIEIRVNDGEVEVSLSSYGITVTNLNDGPTIEAIADQSMEEDSTISVEIEVEDIDSEITTENLSFSSGDTSILSLSGYEFVSTSSVILSPESNQYGEVEIEISVSDGVESESSSFTLTVSNVNDEPSISEIRDVSTQEDESVVVTFNVGDIDNELTTENLSFESGNIYVVEASGYEFISTSSVEISPKSNQSGTVEIMIEVEDGESSVSTEFTLTVETVNDDPEVEEISDQRVSEDGTLEISLEVSDVDDSLSESSLSLESSDSSLVGVGDYEFDTTSLLRISPAEHEYGELVITVSVTDGTSVEEVSFNLTVESVNDEPVFTSEAIVNVAQDEAYSYTVEVEDIDGDGISYSASITTDLTGNDILDWITFDSESGVFYGTPADKHVGTYNVVVEAEVGGDIATQSYELSVNDTADYPTVITINASTTENEVLVIELVGTDNETEDLTYSIIESPSSGEIEISGNEATYTPEDYYNGEVTFSYVAIDETDLMSNEATVNITIWPQNDAPEGSTQSVEMEEDSSITIELYGYDIDGDEITYDVLEDVKSGELYQESSATHTVIYTPTENYVGEVSFSYQVNDGLAQSSEEIIWITIENINDAPEVEDIEVEDVIEDEEYEIELKGFDVDGDSLTYNIEVEALYGETEVSGNYVIYKPSENYYGQDELSYRAEDAEYSSNEGVIYITINAVNDAPEVEDISESMQEDGTLEISLVGTDVDDSELSYEIVSDVSKGQVSISGSKVTYVPSANENGTDQFSYWVYDGSGSYSEEGVVEISISEVNDYPIGYASEVVVTEDYRYQFSEEEFGYYDIDGDEIAGIVIESLPLSGNLYIETETLTSTGDMVTEISRLYYLTGHNEVSTMNFEFSVYDGEYVSTESYEMEIVVTPLNDAPEVGSLSATVNEGGRVSINIEGSDLEGDDITYILVSGVNDVSFHGTAYIEGSVVVYEHDGGESTSDLLKYKATDGDLETRPREIEITIYEVNDAPEGESMELETMEDEELEITLIGTDVDTSSSELEYVITSYPSNGSISQNNDLVTYYPTSNYVGVDYFEYEVSDGVTSSEIMEVHITINTVNDEPYSEDGEIVVTEDMEYEFSETDIMYEDIEGDEFGGVLLETLPVTGSLYEDGSELKVTGSIISDMSVISYVPSANDTGGSWFEYYVYDGEDISTRSYRLSIEIVEVNDVPEVEDIEVSVTESSSVEITLIGYDVEGDISDYKIETEPLYGTVSITQGEVTYTHLGGGEEEDYLYYVVSDGVTESEVGEVVIEIIQENDAPTLSTYVEAEVEEGSSVNIGLDVYDEEGDTLNYTIITEPTYGEYSFEGTTLNYSHDGSESTADYIEYQVDDGELSTQVALITISITPYNNSPTGVSLNNVTVNEQADIGEVVGEFSAEDVDSSEFSYSILNNSEEEDGYYFGVSDNELITAALLTYNYQSSYELQIEVMDSGSKTYIEWIEITVLQVDSDGDSVSDHEDAFPTDNRYSYYELSVNSEGTIETETYYDASYEEVLLVTTTYGSDGSIEEIVTEETENGVTTITYETGTGEIENITKHYVTDAGVTINVDLDGSGVTESIQTEETQSDGQVLESYYDAEWVLIKEVEYISYSDGSEETRIYDETGRVLSVETELESGETNKVYYYIDGREVERELGTDGSAVVLTDVSGTELSISDESSDGSIALSSDLNLGYVELSTATQLSESITLSDSMVEYLESLEFSAAELSLRNSYIAGPELSISGTQVSAEESGILVETLELESGASLDISDGSMLDVTYEGIYGLNSELALSGASSILVDALSLEGSQDWELSNGSVITVNSIIGTGTLNMVLDETSQVDIYTMTSSGDELSTIVYNGGSVKIGQTDGSVEVSDGTLSVFSELDYMSIEETLTLGEESVLSIELGVTVSIGELIVEGGSLELIYTDTETTDSDSLILGLTYDLSYMTVVEDTDGDVVMITFDVLDVGRIEGEFDEVNVTGEISGFEWSVSDIETTGQISAVNVDALDALKDGVEVLVYPSPVEANETFEAGFMIENSGDVTLEIYDVLGRKQVSIEEQVTAYTYTRVSINPVDFEYGNMSAGVYMIVLIYEGEILAESWFGVLP